MKTVLFTFSILFSLLGTAQTVTNIEDIKPSKEFDNILVEKINTDTNATSFVIWIKKGVKSHHHVFHTENLYVIAGEGEMTIGDKTITISPGDYFSIPMGVYHSLKVTSKYPMKVLSVQSPEFFGKDRVFKKEEKLKK